MKNCENSRNYLTDYPFTELEDIPHKLAPMRSIEILEYDDNKYCKIKVFPNFSDKTENTFITEIKSGYIYQRINRKVLEKYVTKKVL